jgi:hypothetical protein
MSGWCIDGLCGHKTKPETGVKVGNKIPKLGFDINGLCCVSIFGIAATEGAV